MRLLCLLQRCVPWYIFMQISRALARFSVVEGAYNI